jgi:hypothetical protein
VQPFGRVNMRIPVRILCRKDPVPCKPQHNATPPCPSTTVTLNAPHKAELETVFLGAVNLTP